MPFIETFLAVLFSAAAFLVLLMLIVFVHEYGHFSVARWLGVKVDVFSIGFGKPILKWIDRKGTEWRISWLPLGGYVKFFGDVNEVSQGPAEAAEKPVTTQFPRPSDAEAVAGQMSAEERKVCFHFKPVWRRAAIVAAGPVANFVLAVAIFSVLYMSFGRVVVDPVVGGVAEGSPAEQAGFLPGDRIVEANGRQIRTFAEIYDVVLVSGGDEMEIVVERGGGREIIAVTPQRVEDLDRYNNKVTRWQLGIAPPGREHVSYLKYGPLAAVSQGFGELKRILSLTVKYIGNVVLGKEDARQLGGPIKMAKYAGQSVKSGFDDSTYAEPPGFFTKLRASLVDFISLAAVVSVSIGFLNLMPVPVLDGGHLLYYAYEAVAGKPLGARAQAIGFRLGIVLLASLMIFVTWNDINS